MAAPLRHRELKGGLGLTEADAGTDLQGIRTVARRDGDDYVVNGAKLWITNALQGDILALLVKTDTDAQPRHRGMTMLIVPTRDVASGAELPGVKRGKKLKKLGYRGIDTGEISFDGYRCDAGMSLVGGEEGKGFLMATGGLEIGRVNVAARGVGIAQRALAESVRYAQMRKTMGKPIAEHQAIQLKLGEMAGQRPGPPSCWWRTRPAPTTSGGRIDHGGRHGQMVRIRDRVSRCATEAMRIHGAYGYSKEYRDRAALPRRAR